MTSFYTSEEVKKSATMREDLEDDFAVSEDVVSEDEDDEKEVEADFIEGAE
mgnify:CR=1 FL=1